MKKTAIALMMVAALSTASFAAPKKGKEASSDTSTATTNAEKGKKAGKKHKKDTAATGTAAETK